MHSLRRATLITLFLLAGSASWADAHPELGSQPDGTAEVELRIFLEMNPQDVKARTRLGFILYRKNRLKDAEREFSQVLAKSPRDADAHYGIGLVKLKDKKPADAVQWLQKSLALNGEQSSCHFKLGTALEQAGRLKEAEASYRRGLEVSDRLIRRGIDVEHEQETRKNIQGALQVLRQKNTAKGSQ